MASELSELRAELWRTRDDLERMKSRGTPTSADRSPRRLFDRHHHTSPPPPPAAAAVVRDGERTDRNHRHRKHWHDEHEGVGGTHKRGDLYRNGGDGGIRSGPTSPPTSGDSSPGSDADNNHSSSRGLGARRGGGGGGIGIEIRGISSPGRKIRSSRGVSTTSSGEDAAAAQGSPEEVAAEETIFNLELEGAAFKNWTEEASSIAIRLIEEVKMLRWEKAGWAGRERAAERAAEDLRARAESLEERLRSAEADGRRSQQALARAQQEVEREQARAKAERAKGDALRAAAARAAAAAAQQEKERIQQQQQQMEADGGGGGDGRSSLVEMLRREKEGADALQRRLDAARAASARHEKERKERRSSRARLEELRRLWGKQLKKVGWETLLASNPCTTMHHWTQL